MEISNCVNITTVVSDAQITSELNLLVLISVIRSVIATFTVMSNILVVVGVIKSIRDDKTARHVNKITKMLMSSMGIADSLFGAVVMPLSVVEMMNNGKWFLGHDLCSFRLAVNNTLSGISIYQILLMATDKYLSICKPLKYRTLNANSGDVIIGISWIFPTLFINIPLSMGWGKLGVEDMEHCYEQSHQCLTAANPHVLLGIFCLTFYLPLTLTYVLYIIVLRDIYQFNQRKNRYKNKLKQHSSGSISSVLPFSKRSPKAKIPEEIRVTGSDPQGGKNIKNSVMTPISQEVKFSGFTKRNLKAFRTIGSIVLCFNLCWFPTSICVIYFAYNINVLPMWSVALIGWSGYLNAALNPILYCGNRSVRRSVKALLWRR